MKVSTMKLRSARFLRSALSVFALSSALALCVAPPANADEAFDLGVKSFTAKDYATAAKYFRKSVDSNSLNANAVYYLALSQHYMGDLANAKASYELLVSKFPGTPAANNARTAMAQLNVKMPKASASSSSASTASSSRSSATSLDELKGLSNDFASLPNECRVPYYVRSSGHMIVMMTLNGRPDVPFLFDTGAETTLITKGILKKLGLPQPSGSPTHTSMGIGNAVNQSWVGKYTLKLGTIERRDFPMQVQEQPLEFPLLGQSFFKDYHYTIEKNGETILFQKRGTTKGSSLYNASLDTNAVPFKREGNEMLVQVEIDGKAIWSYFDTGASSVTLPKEALTQLSLTVPSDARQTMHSGVGGKVRGLSFPVRRIKLGPIEKFNFELHVIDQSLPHPLIGQSLFGDWQYQIDDERRVIRFTRR